MVKIRIRSNIYRGSIYYCVITKLVVTVSDMWSNNWWQKLIPSLFHPKIYNWSFCQFFQIFFELLASFSFHQTSFLRRTLKLFLWFYIFLDIETLFRNAKTSHITNTIKWWQTESKSNFVTSPWVVTSP